MSRIATRSARGLLSAARFGNTLGYRTGSSFASSGLLDVARRTACRRPDRSAFQRSFSPSGTIDLVEQRVAEPRDLHPRAGLRALCRCASSIIRTLRRLAAAPDAEHGRSSSSRPSGPMPSPVSSRDRDLDRDRVDVQRLRRVDAQRGRASGSGAGAGTAAGRRGRRSPRGRRRTRRCRCPANTFDRRPAASGPPAAASAGVVRASSAGPMLHGGHGRSLPSDVTPSALVLCGGRCVVP